MQNDTVADLLVIGNCAMDYTFSVDSFPTIDTKCSSRDLKILAGGQGGNIAWVAARMGLKCSLVTKVGDDGNADLLVQDLKKSGINTSHIICQQGGRTPITAIISDSDTSTRTCIHNKTGIQPLSTSELDFNLCCHARLLVSDSRSPEVSLQCAEIARESGSLVVIAMEHMNDKVVHLCSLAHIVIAPMSLLNQYEVDIDIDGKMQNFAARLLVDILITTVGEEGCFLFADGAVHHIPSYRVDVMDTVGAGVAFAARICYGILQNWPLEEACRFGNFVGTCACQGEGGRSERIPMVSVIAQVLTTLGFEEAKEARWKIRL